MFIISTIKKCDSNTISIVLPQIVLSEGVINTPFVLITSSNTKHLNRLLRLISNSSLAISYGTSFGFLNSRYDYIIEDFVTGKSFIRISIGFLTREIEINEIANLINKWRLDVR